MNVDWLAGALPVPTLILSLAAILFLLLGNGLSSSRQRQDARVELLLAFSAVLVVLVCAGWAAVAWMQGQGAVPAEPNALFQFDSLAAVSTLGVALAAAAIILLSSTYLTSYGLPQAEYYAMLLLSLAGSFLCFGAEHMLVLMLGLELTSLPLVALAGFHFERRAASEAAQKAFFAGATGSAVFFYGVAFLYGATGHLDYAGLQATLDPHDPLALAGLSLVLVGLAIKLGLVPFHQWIPDAGEGAPTSVSVYLVGCGMSTVVLAWLRLMLHGLPDMQWLLAPTFTALAVATLFFANFMALFQRNLKRMLAWLAVAQLGTFMLAFVADRSEAYGAMLFYLFIQAFSLIGAFGVIMTTAEGGRERDRLEHFAGIARHRKVLAVSMTVFMLALAGIPGTAGFWARWQLLSAVTQAGDLGLVVGQTLASVLALYTCMRVPITMFMREEAEETESVLPSTTELAVLLTCLAVIVGLGVWPDPEVPGRMGETLLEMLRSSVG